MTHLLRQSRIKGPTAALERILAQSDLKQKIDLSSGYVINPQNDPWWNVIVTLGGGAVVYLVLLLLLWFLLPLLVPRSIISIGLAKHKLVFWAMW